MERRGGKAVAGLLLAAAIGSAGLVRVPETGAWMVRESRVRASPILLDPGPGFRVPLLEAIARYPKDPIARKLSFGGVQVPVLPLLTREGALVRVEAEISVRIDPDRILRLHSTAGPDFATELLPFLVHAVLEEALRDAPLEVSPAGGERIGVIVTAGLHPALREIGLLLDGFRLGTIEPIPAAQVGVEGWQRDEALAGSRVLLIGWDGADWNILDPLLQAGRLPNLANLIAEGTRARLKTLTPILSPVVWTSIATGVGPERHGIVDFVAIRSATGEQIPVTSNLRRAPAVWNLLTEAGLSVGIVGWLATWPAETVQGFLVSDRVAPPWLTAGGEWLRDPEGKVYPPPLWEPIREEVVEPEAVTPGEIRAFLDPDRAASLLPGPAAEELLGGLRIMIAVNRTHTSIYRRLATPGEALHAVYYPGIDRVSHLFMQYRKPLLPWVNPGESEALGGVVDRFYEFQDSLLPALLERAGADTTVILCSDHGFRTGLDRPRTDPRIGHGQAADWHRKTGVLVLRGPAIRAGERIDPASVLDIVPTLLTLLGLPVPADLEGRVLAEAFRPEFLARHPVRYRSPATTAGGAASLEPVASAADGEIRAELESLGYLSQDTHSGHNNLGILHLQRGQVDDAIREFELALHERPGLPILRINLGRAYLAKGDTRKARAVLRGVVLEHPGAKEAWVLLASLAREEGPEVAEEYLLRAIALDPNDADTRLALGSLLEETRRWDAAAEQYQRVIEIDPDNPECPNRLGILFRRRGDAARARDLFQRALEVDPAFAAAWNNLGLVLQDLGDLEGAEAALRNGLRRNPSHAVLRTSLGSLYFRVQRLEEARTELLTALRIDPEHAQAHNNLAAVLNALGDPTGRIEHLLRALEIQEGFTDARYNLAIAYLEAGRETEGIQELDRTLRIDPSHLSALLRLAQERIRRGEGEEAEGLLRRAREAYPGRPEPLNLLARFRLEAGRREEARRSWEDSLRLDPDQPEVRRELRDLSAPPAGAVP